VVKVLEKPEEKVTAGLPMERVCGTEAAAAKVEFPA
jgi:hypothetical protein